MGRILLGISTALGLFIIFAVAFWFYLLPSTLNIDKTHTSIPHKKSLSFSKNSEHNLNLEHQVKPTQTTPADLAKRSAADLSIEEQRDFYFDIEQVFGTIAISNANPDSMSSHLSRLNNRGEAGLRAIITTLSQPAKTDAQVKQRLFLIEYLSYRMRWDPLTFKAGIILAKSLLPTDIPLRYLANNIAEKSELIEGIARVDWDVAALIVSETNQEQLKRIASSILFYTLIDAGNSKEYALDKVLNINPYFKI